MKTLKIVRNQDQPPDTYTEVIELSQLHCSEFEATLILSIAKEAGLRTYVQTEQSGEPISVFIDCLPEADRQLTRANHYPPCWILDEAEHFAPTILDLHHVRVRNGELRIRNVRFPLEDPTFDLVGAIKLLTPADIHRANDEHYRAMIDRYPHLKKVLGGIRTGYLERVINGQPDIQQ